MLKPTFSRLLSVLVLLVVICFGARAQTTVYNTPAAASRASVPVTPMTTAPAQPSTGIGYDFLYYLTETALGVGCSTATQVYVNAIFQDPNAAAPQTVTVATYTTVNGSGRIGFMYLSSGIFGNFPFVAKPGSVVQFSTTYIPGSGCTTPPVVQIFPTLEQL